MALTNEVYHWLGVTDSNDDGPAVSIDPTQPFTIGPDIWMYEKEKNQLLAWVMKNAKYDPTDTIMFGHLERPELPNWVQYDGTTETTQGVTSLTFVNGATRLSKYSRISTPNGEVILFTADFASTHVSAGVARNQGTPGTPFLNKGDWCKIITPGIPEGSDMGKGPQGGVVFKNFYTGIVEWPVEMTASKAAEKANGARSNDPFKDALGFAWEQSQDQMQADFLWGAGQLDLTTHAYAQHTPTGLDSWIETNVWEVDGVLSRLDFWDIIAEWAMNTPEGGAIVASRQLLISLNNIAFQKVTYNQDFKSDGININSFTIPGVGTIDILVSSVLSEAPHVMGNMYLIPKKGISYRPLRSREVSYSPVVRDEKDVKAGHIHGEYGWEYFGEEKFGKVTGMNF